MPRPRHVAALGSSFAAGPGLAPVVDKAAMRSGRNYPHLLAERLGAELTDLTVSGATTASILRHPQRGPGAPWRLFPPQIAGVPADADLVTVTAGGNDLSYIGALLRRSAAAQLRGRWWTRPLGAALAGSKPTVTEDDVERVATGLAEIVWTARARAPRARLVLVDYFTVVGPATRPGPELPLSPDEIAACRAVGERLATAFERAAERTAADLVRVSALSADHALGSAEPWLAGWLGRWSAMASSFHPNEAGMRAVADAIAEHVG